MKKSTWVGLRPKHTATRARAFCRTTKRCLAETEGFRNRPRLNGTADANRVVKKRNEEVGGWSSKSLTDNDEASHINRLGEASEHLSTKMAKPADMALAPSRRRRPEGKQGEYLRSHDIARILPLSVRQIEAMAAEGSLPAFKMPGCSVWLFDEAVIRQEISIHAAKLSQKHVAPCHTPSIPDQTTISTSAVGDGTSDTSSTELNSGSRLARLMSGRHGRNGTAS